MSTLGLVGQMVQPVSYPVQRDHANRALRCVLDAEIEGLKARLQQRYANAGIGSGVAGVDWDRQVGWLRDSMAKLQARRGALR